MSVIKQLTHPSWDQRRDDWLSCIPSGLNSPTLDAEKLIHISQVIPPNTKLKDLNNEQINLVPDLRERTFSDALFLRNKSLHCFQTAKKLLLDGYSTWSAITMYEASFFAAKSFIYLMGLRDVSRSVGIYFEIFYRPSKRSTRTFDGHLAFNLGSRMTHDILWNIVPRLVRTIKGSVPQNLIKELRSNNFTQFTKERNSLFYDCQTWSRSEDFFESDLISPISYLDNYSFFKSDGASAAEYIDKYYRTAQSFLNIIDIFLSEIGTYAPTVSEYLSQNPGPNPITSAAFN
jgi:hypothetical protein